MQLLLHHVGFNRSSGSTGSGSSTTLPAQSQPSPLPSSLPPGTVESDSVRFINGVPFNRRAVMQYVTHLVDSSIDAADKASKRKRGDGEDVDGSGSASRLKATRTRYKPQDKKMMIKIYDEYSRH
mmetsp:Transcript_29023/g.48768  ORF Transcript_29023/g.48768 Transcript_29023/m.48768 type:complete len:125 (+) Transcript_29023:196-570(+)